jgi:hypothetical protein
MKNFLMNFLRVIMYFCFIVSVGSLSYFLLAVIKSMGEEVSIVNSEDQSPLILGIFIISLLIGFLIRDLLKKIDY